MGNKDIFEYRELNAKENELLEEINGFPAKLVRIQPKGYIVKKEYKKMAEEIYNMPLRSSDIFVATFQRSGTTWTQELVWLLANDLDYKQAAEIPLVNRYAFLEMAMLFDDESKQKLNITNQGEEVTAAIEAMTTPATKILAETPSPRFVKTHLPMSLLPPKLLDTAKVVYVARDPRDVIVSSFHHAKLFKIMEFVGQFKQIWELFRSDLFLLTPYFEHIKEAWAQRNHPNMMFLFYEELSKDLPATITRVAKFLGNEVNEEEMARLCDHLDLKNFKNNLSVNCEDLRELGFMNTGETFIRKGKSGGWRDYFDEDMTREANAWIEDNLRDSDLRFPSMEKK